MDLAAAADRAGGDFELGAGGDVGHVSLSNSEESGRPALPPYAGVSRIRFGGSQRLAASQPRRAVPRGMGHSQAAAGEDASRRTKSTGRKSAVTTPGIGRSIRCNEGGFMRLIVPFILLVAAARRRPGHSPGRPGGSGDGRLGRGAGRQPARLCQRQVPTSPTPAACRVGAALRRHRHPDPLGARQIEAPSASMGWASATS